MNATTAAELCACCGRASSTAHAGTLSRVLLLVDGRATWEAKVCRACLTEKLDGLDIKRATR